MLNEKQRGTEPRRDWTTAEGAEQLRREIEAHWSARGCAVRTWIRRGKSSVNDYHPMYFVRSDMLRGTPRGEAQP